MEIISLSSLQPSKKIYFITWGLIVLGLILTGVSYLRLCSQSCAEGHNYRLFGLPFEVSGLLFFGALAGVHYFARNNSSLAFIELLLFASAVGAELFFIIVQKYYIGNWCPVCLTIASVVLIGAIVQSIAFFKQGSSKSYLQNQRKSMKNIWNKFSPFAAMGIGFIVAFLGLAKFDPLEAAQEAIKEKITFGNPKSDIEIYLFTDWACPACKKVEPTIEALVPELMKDNKVYFVDYVIHPETLNYLPYHLAFQLNNKAQYLKLRHMLEDISKKNKNPSEEQISKAAAKLGVKFKELSYADVDAGEKYFKSLGEKFKVKSTPTMVIINVDSKKGKKLVGGEEITKDNILKSINTLKG